MFLGFVLSFVLAASASDFSSTASEFSFIATKGYLNGGETILNCEFANYSGPCKVDTGVNFSTIPLLEATSSLESVKKIKLTAAGGSALECDLIDVAELFFSGQSVVQKLRWVRCPLDASAKPNIGLDVMAQKHLSLNYSTQTLSLTKPKNVVGDKAFSRTTDDHIILDVGFKGGIKSKAMFDTGASVTVVSQRFYEANSHLFTVVGALAAEDIHGKMIGTQLALLNWLDAGDQRFVAEYVTIINLEPFQEFLGSDVDFILGFNMISNADWYFDFENNLWTAQ